MINISKKVRVIGALYEYWYRDYYKEEFEVIGEGVDDSGDKYYIVNNHHTYQGDKTKYCIPDYHCEIIE